jgi:hypothetical protein
MIEIEVMRPRRSRKFGFGYSNKPDYVGTLFSITRKMRADHASFEGTFFFDGKIINAIYCGKWQSPHWDWFRIILGISQDDDEDGMWLQLFETKGTHDAKRYE